MQEAYLPNVEAVYNSPEATSKFSWLLEGLDGIEFPTVVPFAIL